MATVMNRSFFTQIQRQSHEETINLKARHFEIAHTTFASFILIHSLNLLRNTFHRTTHSLSPFLGPFLSSRYTQTQMHCVQYLKPFYAFYTGYGIYIYKHREFLALRDKTVKTVIERSDINLYFLQAISIMH